MAASCGVTCAQGVNPLESASVRQPHSYGVIASGANGITDGREGFHFAMAGVRASRVLTNNYGPGILRGNFEYGVEVYPYWQAFSPKFDRVRCAQAGAAVSCSQPYTVGGTFHGVSIVPIVLRWNFAARGKWTPWLQGAGGVVWTNHKFPAYGDTTASLNTNGPNGETSVWNFTPQGGVGVHYFTRPERSLDVGLNAVHLSSSSLGDRNPGVNAIVSVSLGYTWWR